MSYIEENKSPIPCIRAMVITSEVLETGTLFIIPCTGATVGTRDAILYITLDLSPHVISNFMQQDLQNTVTLILKKRKSMTSMSNYFTTRNKNIILQLI